jgi:AcrR family transcriptional regulator
VKQPPVASRPESAPEAPRDALLRRCIEALSRNGFSDLSLREIAQAVGTSHRMLIYHFGSRDGLLTAVVNAVEAEQRAALTELSTSNADLTDISRAFWQRIADPSLAPAERLFFEVYAHALRGRPWTDSFRSTVIAAWERTLIELFTSHGFAPDDARSRARLALAVARGLLLDLLITGERDVVDAARELFAPIMLPPPPGAAASAEGSRADQPYHQ